MSSVAFVLIFPVGLVAQEGTYGTGVQTALQFAGESVPANQISMSVGASAFYDDNALSTNGNRQGDEALAFNSALGATKSTEHLTINFDYMPSFLLYRQFDAYDRLNHAATLGLTYRLTNRFSLGLHDAFGYQNGVLPSLSGQQILSGPTPPTALNQGIYAYTTRTLTNMAGLDLTFEKSHRTSLTFAGGYNQTTFGSAAGQNIPLYNGAGFSGSLQYQYRATQHTTFSVLLLHQDNTYRGGEVFGARQRLQIESVDLSVKSQLSPTVTVTLYGGPQYIRTLGQSSGGVGVGGGLQPSVGGSIIKQVRDTALNLSVQRAVTDGGGLYTSVVNTSATFGVRRRLVGQWEGDLHGSGAVANDSLFQLANERTDSLTGGVEISRPLRNGSAFHISYTTLHQFNKGTLPITANFDRNIVMIGFDYRLKTISLGR